MNERRMLKTVKLGPQHHQPCVTREQSVGLFPPFISLQAIYNSADNTWRLLYLTADGKTAETWHVSLAKALQQAKLQFGVDEDEWQDVETPAEMIIVDGVLEGRVPESHAWI
jgi:hypothetical protein